MRKSAIGMRNNKLASPQLKQGFTLLEILIVIVIIGVTLTFALLAFGDFGGKRRIMVAGEHFANYLKLAQQQAILESSTYGMQLTSTSYKVMRFNTKDQQWQNMPTKSVFRQQSLPRNAKIQWNTASQMKNSPEIIINSSGDMSPFSVTFTTKDHMKVITILGTHDGQIKLSNPS